MNRFILRFLYISTTLLLTAALADFCHDKTKGFQLQKIAKPFSFEEKWQPAHLLLEEENAEIFSALKQPFSYLKKGKYCYVFVSKDNKYVLKFFQTSPITPPFWTQISLVRTLLPSTCEKIISQKKIQKELNFTSYKTSFDELKEQNKALYLHLNPTNNTFKNIEIYDAIGVKHFLPLDSVFFILQKKALPFYPYFSKLLSDGKRQEAKELLTQFATLLKERADKGLYDKDLSPRYNLGILDGKIVPFDLDSLRRGSFDKETQMMQDGKKMLRWLKAQDPELFLFLKEKIIDFPIDNTI